MRKVMMTSMAAVLLTPAANAAGGEPTDPKEIIVTAPLARTREDVIAGTSVISGLDLARNLRPTIADTLTHLPGVSASSFGPNASRPILRGFQGARIRVLTDGVGSFDVSSTSVDHAVVINPLLAERVEVVRGPSALLYGSEAIGGVVNVIDTRIPRTVPEAGYRLQGQATYGSAANERSIGAAADAKVTENIVLHADGSYLKSGDMRIGGYALRPELRSQALASAAAVGTPDDEIDFAANAAVKGKLPNTQSRTWDAALGASVITSTGNYGIAVSHYDSLYGVPVRFATQPGEEQEAPRLDVKQTRIDARAAVDTGGTVLEQIRFRLGAARYRHFELEEDNSIGTAFYSQGMEGRVELAQAQHGVWRGVTGVQFSYRDFNVVGDEAFLPRNSTDTVGVFTLQQLDFGKFKIEGGARYEHAMLKAMPGDDQPQFAAGQRDFGAVSGSIGGSYTLFDGWKIGLNLSHSERAPSAEELFANGPHAGTEAFEIGLPTLAKERANGIEAVLHGHGRNYDIEASVYYNRFSNYVDQFATGALEDGLPVYQTAQGKARYYGFEINGSYTLARLGDTQIVADALADYVHATIVDVGPAPRIPPLRLLGGLEARGGRVFGRAEVEWIDHQDRITAFETRTPGFTMVNASIGVHPLPDNPNFSLILSGNNLLDVTARRHASFLKDYAPLAGRDIRVTARFAL
ncbi:TonB-dependent receptor [Sphingomonas sp. ASY06-1R]|uniref:TonB-dependent receptor n=1 Tax=Sphingomonas sp. ASY06-1R TaxID=3445771 RepID=UPI003FA200C5